MKTQASLKICVLGGRSFGKTSLLSSLILISGDESSGISVTGDNEKKLHVFNDYKSNNGKLIATGWEDICPFKYNLTGNGNRKYQITFVDYPGEFFQKVFSDDGNFFASKFLQLFRLGDQKDGQEKTALDNNRSFTKGDEKLARRLAKEMESSDAFIVLLPADVTKEAYKVNLQVFKTRLETLLERIHKINPYIPVCLAVNKWDMFDRGYDTINEVLQEKPYKDFSNMLHRECGEHYFYEAISAFGQNRASEATNETERENFKEEWDRKSEPVNVMQMLLTIADKAEKSRYLHLRERYKNAFKITKVLQYPFVFLSTFLKGANQLEDRAFCKEKLIKCMSALGALVISTLALCFALVVTLTSLGEYAYLSYQEGSISEIEKSFSASKKDNTTREAIQELRQNLDGHPVKLAFFCRAKKNDMTRRILEIEREYNLRLLSNAIAYCERPSVKDEPPTVIKSSERQERCSARIRYLEQAKAKITELVVRATDGRSVSDHFDSLIAEEKQLLVEIAKDGSLDDALYALKTKSESEKCMYIEALLDKYESLYPHRKTDFARLRGMLTDMEQKYHDALMEDLGKLQDLTDLHNFDGRIALAQQRINRLQQEASHLSKRSRWHQVNNDLLAAEKQRINEWTHDKNFFVAFRTVMSLPPAGKISKIIEFQNNFPKSSYSRCSKEWDKAEGEKIRLIKAVNDTLADALKNLDLNAQGISADERVKRLELAVTAYQQAMQENPTENNRYAEEISRLNLLIPQATRDIGFEAAFNIVKKAPVDGKLRKIEGFLKVYTRDDWKHKVTSFDELDRIVAEIKKHWSDYRKSEETKNAEDLTLSRAERIARINSLLVMYRKLLSEYPESSQEFQEIQGLKNTLENNLAHDNKFFEAFDIAMSAAEQTRIQSLTMFMKQYPLAVYPRCEKEFRQAERERSRLIKLVNDNILAARQGNDYSEAGISAIERIARIKRLLETLSAAAKTNPVDAEKYAEEISRLQLQAQTFEKDVLFETEFNKVIGAPSTGKLKKIHAFLTDSRFIPENYPHKKAAYDALRKQEGNLLAQFASERKTAERDYADDVKLDRSARLSRALQLSREYERLLAEYLPSSNEFDDLAEANRSLSQAIEEHRRYKKLADDFSKIRQLQDHYTIIKEIALFEAKTTHVRSDYPQPDGVDIFSTLDQIKERAIAGIKKEFQGRISPLTKPAKTDFAGLAEYYQNCLKIANEIRGMIGEGNSLSAWITERTTYFSQNAVKYQKFSRIATQVSKLILTADIKDIDSAKNRLIAIRAFSQNQDWFKTLYDEPELSNLANQLRNTLAHVEDYIGNYLNVEVSKIAKSLPPDASKKEKMDNWEKQINIIDEFLPIMIQSQGNALYSTFNQKRKDIFQKLGEAKRAELFRTQFAALNDKLQVTEDLNEKISLLDGFIKNYSSFESFAEEIAGLKIKRETFVKERDFKIFEQGCVELFARRPSESARSFELTTHRDEIKAKLGDDGLERFKDHPGYPVLLKRLNEEIAYVKKAIGDGSWHDIEKKMQSYHDAPSEETKDKLENALNIFDENEFPNYTGQVREAKLGLQQDWEARCRIVSSWEKLQNRPTLTNWRAFQNACINSQFWAVVPGSGDRLSEVPGAKLFASTKGMQLYLNYYNSLVNPNEVRVELISVSGLESQGSVSGKLRIHFKFQNSLLLDMKFAKPNSQYRWDEGQWKDIKSGNLKNPLQMRIDSLLNFKVYSLGNWSNESTFDNFNINAIDFFVSVVAEGRTVEKDYTGDGGVRIRLRFSK